MRFAKFLRAVFVAALVAFVIAAAYVIAHPKAPDLPMKFWQDRAAKVHVGMTREDAEKLLPREDYKGLLWRLEDFRVVHALRWLPPLRYAPAFAMVHSDFHNAMGYEVAPGIFVVIRYDLAGSTPPNVPAGRGTVQPKDRVIDAPEVIGTPVDPSTYVLLHYVSRDNP